MIQESLFDRPCKTETELLERYGGIALEKQIDFSDIIGHGKWNADVQRAEIVFNDNLIGSMQILGSFANEPQTWLWSWANQQSNLPDHILQEALYLKQYGEENGIELLTARSFDFSKEELHQVGLIASGLFDSSAYYLADYGSGLLVVTVKSEAIETNRKNTHLRVPAVFSQLISTYELDHRHAFSSYAILKGYTLVDNGNQILASNGTDLLVATFDEQGRLTHLDG